MLPLRTHKAVFVSRNDFGEIFEFLGCMHETKGPRHCVSLRQFLHATGRMIYIEKRVLLRFPESHVLVLLCYVVTKYNDSPVVPWYYQSSFIL